MEKSLFTLFASIGEQTNDRAMSRIVYIVVFSVIVLTISNGFEIESNGSSNQTQAFQTTNVPEVTSNETNAMEIPQFSELSVNNTEALKVPNDLKPNAKELEAAAFAHQVSDKLFNFYDEIGSDIFTNDGSKFNYKESILKASQLLIDIVNGAKEFDYLNFKNKKLEHAFTAIVHLAEESVIGGEQYWKILTSIVELDTLVREKTIAKYENRTIQLAYIPEVVNIIENSTNPDEVKYYWLIWKDQIGAWARTNFSMSIDGLKIAANLTGMSTADFWLQNHNITEMETIMEDIRPLYFQMHAFIRNRLRQKYGVSIIKPDGLIPDHLFQHVFKLAFKNVSILEELYPHKKLPHYDTIIKRNYSPKELYMIVKEFYKNLGFTSFPNNYWDDRIKISKAARRNEDDCQADVFYFTPNIYLSYCKEINFEKFIDAYSQMGKIHYAKEMTELPAYYFKTHGLEHSIGKALKLSASTLSNLLEIGLIRDFDVNEEVDMNQLIRKSVHLLFSIPVDFVHTKLMVDLLSGDIEMSEVNKNYWYLMEKYVGVEPSYDREPDSLDLPHTFYSDILRNTQPSQFESVVLGHQIFKKLCEISGKNQSKPLHKCNFNGNKNVGETLKKIMRLGTSRPLNEVLGLMFPEGRSMNAESLLEYYNPVYEVITKKNIEENAKIGWKRDLEKYN